MKIMKFVSRRTTVLVVAIAIAADLCAGFAVSKTTTAIARVHYGQCGLIQHSIGRVLLGLNDIEQDQCEITELSIGGSCHSKDDVEGEYEMFWRHSLGCVQLEWPIQGISEMFSTLSLGDIPSSRDWREKGAVNPVKNQGNCDSCWAFSVVGAIEAIVKIERGKLCQLSVQELVDCDTRNNGCHESRQNRAFEYVILMKGLNEDWEYPYKAKVGECRSKRQRRFGQIEGYERVAYNEKDLKVAVARQPISAIVSLRDEFINYKGGGVFKGPCVVLDPLKNNKWHAILIVGYGTSEEDGTPYWLIKNTWGVHWGEDGYMRMKMGDTTSSPWGLCGIAIQAYYPTL